MFLPFLKVAAVGTTAVAVPGTYYLYQFVQDDSDSILSQEREYFKKLFDEKSNSMLTEEDRKEFEEMEAEVKAGMTKFKKQFGKALSWLFTSGAGNYKEIVQAIASIARGDEDWKAKVPGLAAKLQELLGILEGGEISGKIQISPEKKADHKIVTDALVKQLKGLDLEKIKQSCKPDSSNEVDATKCVPDSFFESIPKIFEYASGLSNSSK